MVKSLNRTNLVASSTLVRRYGEIAESNEVDSKFDDMVKSLNRANLVASSTLVRRYDEIAESNELDSKFDVSSAI